jgi:GNAT acetyltransferase-like protein
MALAVDWITAQARSSRYPRAWESGYSLIAAPLLVRGAVREYVGRATGRTARALCIGREARFEELLETLMEGAEAMARGDAGSLWAPPTAVQGTAADLTAVEIHPWAAERFRRAGFLIVPQFVRWLGDPQYLPPARPRESLRSDLRKIAAAGFAPEWVEQPTRDEWRQFWGEMIVPYLSRRFGGRAWIPTGTYTRTVTRKGSLLYVTQNGRRVAATGMIKQGDRLWIALMGIRQGDAELVRQGAGAALYMFEIEHARAAGIRQIDIGRTSPFLRDGISRYKEKFGYSPVRDPLSPMIAVRIDPRHEGLNAALAENPVLVDDGTELAPYPA